MSGATTWKPASASALIWWRQEYQLSGKPWHSKTRGPSPSSTTFRLMPLALTIRSIGLLMFLVPPKPDPKHPLRAYSPRTARTKQGLPAKLQGIYVGGYWQRSHPYVLGWMSAARNPSPSRYGRPSSAPLR